MEKNKYHSYNKGQLSKGCQYCVRGEKLVLFVTGICPRRCAFCPVSDQKYQHDVQFANERELSMDNSVNDLIKEAEIMRARGAGITGGDPLAKLDRTCDYIQKLKEKFDKVFHIHLYTSLNLVNLEGLKKLFEAGLDEIRFHLDLSDKKLWEKLKLAKTFQWDVGVEVPLIIGKEKELKELIDFVAGKYDGSKKIDFLNLNELEIADNQHYSQEGQPKDDLSYAIEGSLDLGLRLLRYIEEHELKLPTHLCTAKLKDAIQLSERIKRESLGMKKGFDIVDEEGMLLRGALYLPELMPGFNYREKLKSIDKRKMLEKLQPFYDRIKKKFNLEEGGIHLDPEKPRILISKRLCKKKTPYFLSIGLKPAIVTEYPTADQLEIEVEFLE